MKKTIAYFCLFFVGSLLPFIVVEFYFQDYYAIGLIGFIAIVVLTLCISIEYVNVKLMTKNDNSLKKIDYVNLLQKKEQNKRAAFYFFRKNYW